MPVSDKGLGNFKLYLYERERSAATAEKYARAVRDFLTFAESLQSDVSEAHGHGCSTKSRTPPTNAAADAPAEEAKADCRCKFTKETVIAYKQQLQQSGYAVASVNAVIAGVNCYLRYTGRPECCVRQLKMQRQIYRPQERELTKQEYMRLLETAKRQDKRRLYMILQTIAGTGIRISELRFLRWRRHGRAGSWWPARIKTALC